MSEYVNRFRNALVTGASRRIGRAIVEDLAAHGFSVAIHHHDSEDEAQTLTRELRNSGARAAAFKADLTDPDACNMLVERIDEQFGTVDLLVNNASVFWPDEAATPRMDQLDRHMAIHLKAPLLLTAGLARQEELEEGVVVNMIDQRVWALSPNFFTYTLSKSALWTATQTMAQAFAPQIRVNAIGPGPTLPSERQSARDFAGQIEALPLKRGPELKEFGATVRYFYENRSVTGQMLAIDGGQHLAWQTPDIVDITE